MKQNPSLDDLMLLLAVGEAGGLAGAARQTGVSVPTLGRRMTALEAQMGRRLFERGARGYQLTADGRALAQEAAPLRATASRIAAFAGGETAPRVRVTAGTWTAHFLARSLPATHSARWRIEFLSSYAMLDVARREADIGIRNRRPDQPWLAGRRTATVRMAFYATGPDVRMIATRPETAGLTPSERWLHANMAAERLLMVSDVRLALDLARAGHARVLVPTFIGDAEPGLARLGDPVDALSGEEWLISHHEARNDPPVRAALDAIARVLTDRTLRETT
ncbi:LysR family transcriptional regulator [Pseudaestuariivita atlantica]|uniref:HTH lysR-type domain-containing protein n=1 Tax=Pseudaestuariivita atlantica TaxID=1317121 RepID=A0A0L1JL29_9RHOB|nr:LysR family transcriptional regulator [Pseudaestuariivita atlantica]KNG92456.1 hypothetical protein ATO11_17775 [Pseudaestuariivita atlantica]